MSAEEARDTVPVDMSGAAVAARLRLTRPPDLRPEHRLDHKIDMSGEAIAGRLRRVAQLVRLGRALNQAASASLASSPASSSSPVTMRATRS